MQNMPTNPPPNAKLKNPQLVKVGSKPDLLNNAGDSGIMSGSFYASNKKCLVEGNETFANVKILSTEKAERISNEESYQWRLDDIREQYE